MNPTNPTAAGFDSNRLDLVRDVLQEGLDRDLYTGAAFWAARQGTDAVLHCVGHTNTAREVSVGPDTLFDLASLTKPVATAPSVLMLVADGLIELSQSVGEFFPDHETSHLRDVTLFHLLTHTSGLPAWRDLHSDSPSRESSIERLFRVPLQSEPGAAYEYSCLGYIMLGLVVEVVTGEGLGLFAGRRIFEPLKMRHTLFNPGRRADIVSTGAGSCGRVHDENSCAFDGISGNAGLFATVQDLATFCHTITFERQSEVQSPFGLALRNKIFVNALSESIGGHTLGGWFIWPNPMLPAGDLVTKATVGHSGFTGTAIIVDPINELCSVLLTNRVCRPDDGSQFRTLRRRVFNALLGAIVW